MTVIRLRRLAVVSSVLVIGLACAAAPLPTMTVAVALALGPLAIVPALRPVAMLAILGLSQFTALIKAATGFRYAPLALDLGVFLLAMIPLAERVFYGTEPRPEPGALAPPAGSDAYLTWTVSTLVCLAVLAMFNPYLPSLAVGLEGLRKFAFMTLGFIAARELFTRPAHVRALAWVVGITTTISAAYGLKQFFLPSSLDFRLIELSTASRVTFMMGGHIRAFGTLSGPFHLGVTLVMSLLMLVAMLRHGRTRWLVVPIVVQVLALLATVTKSNWFALTAGLAVFLFIWSPSPRVAFLRVAVLCLGVALGLGVAYLALSTSPQFRTVRIGIEAFAAPWAAKTFRERVDLWQSLTLPAAARGWAIGYGTGAAGEGLAPAFEGSSAVFFQSHSLYLKILLEVGVIGVALFLILVLGSVSRTLAPLPAGADPHCHMARDWIIGTAAAVMVAGLTGAILDAYPANLLFWCLLGLGTRLREITNFSDRAVPAP